MCKLTIMIFTVYYYLVIAKHNSRTTIFALIQFDLDTFSVIVSNYLPGSKMEVGPTACKLHHVCQITILFTLKM